MLQMSREDINATYGDTYVGFRTSSGVISPLYVARSEERNSIIGEVDGDRMDLSINDSRLVLSHPDSGAYNVNEDKAVFVGRAARRQWRRGVRPDSLSLTGDAGFSASLVRAMYNPEYLTFAELLQKLESASFTSGAVSKDFWVRKVRDAKYPLIMFRSRIVGEVKENGDYSVVPAIKKWFEEAINDN